jgi:hypothetical protein
MTSKEFVIWLKGFTEGVHEFNITPKQWDALKDKLAEVVDEEKIGTPIGPGWGVPNSAPFVTLPHITPGPSTDPYNPYKITCRGEETPTGTTITTTPGTTGFITISNPNIASFGTGSTGILNTYNLSTSTTYGYPSGSAWSYTTSNEKIF